MKKIFDIHKISEEIAEKINSYMKCNLNYLQNIRCLKYKKLY